MRTAMPRQRGYTLIELLVVMGIILLMLMLILLSVSSMLRSSRMSRAVSLLIGAVDEARTAAVTLRRSTKVDLTRVDAEGRLSRLTVVGPFFNENFESYNDATAVPPAPSPAASGWMTTTSWNPPGNPSPPPSITTDGSRCLRMEANQRYWNIGARVDTVKQDDFEFNMQARIKFLPCANRTQSRTVKALCAVQESGADISDAYAIALTINPSLPPNYPGRNTSSTVTLATLGGGALTPVTDAVDNVETDASGNPSATALLIENVWYRVNLSVKLVTDPVSKTSRAIVAGKVWADGQLEPWAWTVGPCEDAAPLSNGPGGFAVEGPSGADVLLDDVLFDIRPIRVLPAGLRLDPMALKTGAPMDSTNEGDWEVAKESSPFYFPVLFRPDGTSAERYVVRFTDFTSGDRRYLTIDQNTGRARAEHSLKDAIRR